MTRKISITLVLSLLLGLSAWSQQLPIYTQYRENQGFINPASISSDYFLSRGVYNLTFGASYRHQWALKDQSPRTAILRGEHLYQPGYGGVGLLYGANIVHDQTGPISFTGAYGRIGGVLHTGGAYSNDGFNVALSFGVVQYRLKGQEVKLIDPGDPLQTNQVRVIPDLGAGIYYFKELRSEDILYGGVSVPQLFALDLTGRDPDNEFRVTRVRHYYAILGFYKFLYDYGALEPSVWFKYVPNAPINIDINLRYQMNQNLWIGAGGNTNGTIHLEAGLAMEEWLSNDYSLKIGYGLDVPFVSFGPRFGLTHELNVTALFGTR